MSLLNNKITAISTEEALAHAGLNWEVQEQPLFRLVDGNYQQVQTHKLLTKSTDQGELSVVSRKYHPLQNKDAFSFFDPFLQSGEATIESAGSLRNGRKIWILAKINRNPLEIAKNDLVNKYLLLSNSHDGTMAIRIGFCPIRVICANMLATAHRHKNSALVRIHHSSVARQRIEHVREIINLADATFEATAIQYKQLTSKNISKENLTEYVHKLFAPKTPEMTELQKKNLEKLEGKITYLFEHGRGNASPGVRGTWWAAYNAVTEYLSHEYGRTEENRLNQLWFGRNHKLNQAALDLALKAA